MKKKVTEISSVYSRMCKIKSNFKTLAENLKPKDHLEVVSTHTVKPAYNRTSRNQNVCFHCRQVPFNKGTCVLAPRDPRSPDM
jgi:hypothetical protein